MMGLDTGLRRYDEFSWQLIAGDFDHPKRGYEQIFHF